MSSVAPQIVIFAETPEALVQLCGVSMLERQLRMLQRLGCTQATVVTSAPDELRTALEPRSWASRALAVQVIAREALTFSPDDDSLVLNGAFYYDARLLRALRESAAEARLIDSAPPASVQPLLPTAGFSGAARLRGDPRRGRERTDLPALDAATVPSYVRGMRRELRPVFFPAPPPELRRRAEDVILDTAANGMLDLPAILEGPIETWLVRRLCRTSITPNQITAFGMVVSLAAAFLFARGWLWWGILAALAIGVIDGLDGKQARVKIETTAAGKLEHVLDFFLEGSWWAALAFWFQRSGQLPHAWGLCAVIVGAEVVDQLAKQAAQRRIPRLLDDHSPFDRFVRRIGARRNIYVWLLLFGLLLGVPAQAFVFCAGWGALTAAVHALRAIMLARELPVAAQGQMTR